ncbi:hypothetical protein HOY82DRAFT_593936 [Tuber indicum]|nr:hypothetical protein HOY82DRAFT_593936 [Tuber indicum]
MPRSFVTTPVSLRLRQLTNPLHYRTTVRYHLASTKSPLRKFAKNLKYLKDALASNMTALETDFKNLNEQITKIKWIMVAGFSGICGLLVFAGSLA